MLIDPKFSATDGGGDPSLLAILTIISSGDPESIKPARIQKGVYRGGGHNFNHLLGEPYFDSPMIADHDDEYTVTLAKRPEFFVCHDGKMIPWATRQLELEAAGGDGSGMPSYGVCDSPEQLLSMYRWEEDERLFCLALTEVRREDQPSDGGWRWHKWGPYIGTQKTEYEYIRDEKNIESVFCGGKGFIELARTLSQ